MIRVWYMVIEDQKWAKVTLLLRADVLPLDALAERLGLSGKSIGRKGEHIGGRSHRAKYDEDLWCWDLPAEPGLPLEVQLEMALDAIEPKRAEIEKVIIESGGNAELLLGYSSGNGQGGAFFSVGLIGRLEALRIPLVLDLYPPTIEDD